MRSYSSKDDVAHFLNSTLNKGQQKAVKDDLTMIKGIGPVHAKELAAAGFTSFAQIAKLSKSDIEKIDAIDGISAGMVESEDWSAPGVFRQHGQIE